MGKTEDSGAIERLRIGRGPWTDTPSQAQWSRPADSFRTDIVVVGAGITGSLLAQHLIANGHRVVVVDRLRPGQGSTAASTAMLQWEIDKSLGDLAALYDFERAADAYRRSLAAVQGLGEAVRSCGVACAFMPRPALYLAAEGEGSAAITREYTLRQAAGLPVTLIEAAALRRDYGLNRSAAIRCDGAAEVDPLALSQTMLRLAQAEGARLIHADVEAYDHDARAARVRLSDGTEIEAAHLILATGYEMPPFVHAPAHRESASWAAVSAPGTPLGFWPERALVWEDATPYLYMRTTVDGRILVGGEDEAISDPQERDARAPQKAAIMHAKLERLWGRAMPPFDLVWSAAFGETDDGLPLIGAVPGAPRVLAAYGYGGNGITYSFLASRMIAALVAGRRQDWFDDFALDRPAP